jgi:hypothetical protein
VAFGEAGVVRILLAVSKVGPACADGDWPLLASTFSTNFIKNGLLSIATHGALAEAVAAPFTKYTVPKTLFAISASGFNPALMISAADVSSVDDAVLAETDSATFPFAKSKAKHFVDARGSLWAAAVVLLGAGASSKRLGDAASLAAAAAVIDDAAEPFNARRRSAQILNQSYRGFRRFAPSSRAARRSSRTTRPL